jgi:Peptidase family S41/N-terminal domain of Peptidase_S41 in eukaryotic IRBP
MKRSLLITLFFATSFILACKMAAQENKLTDEFKSATIEKINELVNDNYVFPDVAKSTGEHLVKKLKQGRFNDDTTAAAFSKSLTDEVQSVNHDKHMRVRTGGAAAARGPENSGDGGFKEVKMLEGNIGYMDMRLFFPASVASSLADEHMKTLASADAIIIDLRYNGGGNPDMVQYLCSYFFDKKIHLNSLYNRVANTTREFWTIDVKGKKMPNVPLFILTSKRTFSAAEEFSYNMQTQKRAVLIGETTGGGANPGGVFRINDQLSIFIPTGKAINPVTGTNWEGVGVKPDISIPADEALNKAKVLAEEAVKKYRELK